MLPLPMALLPFQHSELYAAWLENLPASCSLPSNVHHVAVFGVCNAVKISLGCSPVIVAVDREPYQWCVWQSQCPAGIAAARAQREGPARGRLLAGRPLQLTQQFKDHYLPFFDQFSQAVRLWSPDGRAFCYTAAWVPAGLTNQAVDHPEGGHRPWVMARGALPFRRFPHTGIGCLQQVSRATGPLVSRVCTDYMQVWV